MPFATTTEINDLLNINPPLASSGRTSGVKQGSPCGLKISQVGGSTSVAGYKLQGVTQAVPFSNIITFIRNSPDQTSAAI
jgi:hypothetical protein